jgi:hypothetical protein
MGDLLKESAIVFLIGAILLISGCVSNTAISLPPTTSTVGINQPAADFTSQYPPDPSHWIEIDPIRNFQIGSDADRILFNISGTTNLPVNSLLFIEVYRKDPGSGKEEKDLLWNAVAPVENDGRKNNTVFYAENVTKGFYNSIIKPGDYLAIIRRYNVSASKNFTILGKDPLPFIWIRIDPFGERYHGDIFNITGTTNLPAGSEIIVKAVRHYPAYLYPSCSVKESDVIHLRECVNSIEHFEKRVRIDKADGGDNTWIISADTTGWCECYRYRFEAIKEGWDNVSSASEEFGFHYE